MCHAGVLVKANSHGVCKVLRDAEGWSWDCRAQGNLMQVVVEKMTGARESGQTEYPCVIGFCGRSLLVPVVGPVTEVVATTVVRAS